MHFTPAEAIRPIDEGDVDAAVIHPPGWDPNLDRRRCRRSGTIPAAWRSWVPMTSSRQTPEWELRGTRADPVAADAVRSPWGEPTFAQPPGKGQMRRQRLLVAVPTESRSYR